MKRQFIAGATCPECGQMDKIQRVIDGDTQWMECVSCGATKDLDANQPISHWLVGTELGLMGKSDQRT